MIWQCHAEEIDVTSNHGALRRIPFLLLLIFCQPFNILSHMNLFFKKMYLFHYSISQIVFPDLWCIPTHLYVYRPYHILCIPWDSQDYCVLWSAVLPILACEGLARAQCKSISLLSSFPGTLSGSRLQRALQKERSLDQCAACILKCVFFMFS